MKQLLTFLSCLAVHLLFAQKNEIPPVNAANGEYRFEKTECITSQARALMEAQATANRAFLVQTGVLQDFGFEIWDFGGVPPPKSQIPNPKSNTVVLFDWPLRQAAGFNDPGYFGTGGFVDHNPLYPDQLLDYDCGNRTYDVANGYNHSGVDIFTWPYFWEKMDSNAVEVIAAASGIIVDKVANDPNDKNCAFCSSTCTGNYFIIEHSDGSWAFYYHLKYGTLNAKTIGASVAQGEYLGVVGSSGNSSAPHLHFEVWAGSTFSTLIDPYSGTCNSMNSSSWWANQPAYREPKINKVMTHSAAPPYNYCYPDIIYASDQFEPGALAYFAVYLKDERLNHTKSLTIYKPDDSVWQIWTHTPDPNSTEYYSASWWYWYWFLPSNGPAGSWRFEVSYEGQTVSHDFEVFSEDCVSGLLVSGSPLPSHTYRSSGDLAAFNASVANGSMVTFTSDTAVLLNGEFVVGTGGVFEVNIVGCGN